MAGTETRRNRDPAKMSWIEMEKAAELVQKAHADAKLPPSYITAWIIYTFAEGTSSKKDIKSKLQEFRNMIIAAKEKKRDEVVKPYRPINML